MTEAPACQPVASDLGRAEAFVVATGSLFVFPLGAILAKGAA